MLDACTKCGKCFEVCPITGAAGIADADPRDVISGVLDILRMGEGPEASRKWASSCVLSGECIKACEYGVNPRFLLNMARVAMARAEDEPRARRKLGVDGFRLVARDVMQLSRLQLTNAQLARLGQIPRRAGCVRRAARRRVLHRLQCAQDAAHRAPGARYHGRARRELPCHGRPEPLLRHRADAHRRHRHVRPRRREHAGQARAARPGRCWPGVRAAWCSSTR